MTRYLRGHTVSDDAARSGPTTRPRRAGPRAPPDDRTHRAGRHRRGARHDVRRRGRRGWIGGEPFLTVMGAIGCLMTAWVGALTLLRG